MGIQEFSSFREVIDFETSDGMKDNTPCEVLTTLLIDVLFNNCLQEINVAVQGKNYDMLSFCGPGNAKAVLLLDNVR